LIFVTPEDEVVDDEPKPPEPASKPKTFQPLNISEVRPRSPSESRANLRETFAAAATDPRYHERSRFRGITQRDYGKLRGHDDEVLPWLNASVAETEELATLFNVPQLRGTRRLRKNSRALMNMGDGSLGVNDDMLKRYLRDDPLVPAGLATPWRPDFDDAAWPTSQSGRAFNTIEYFTTGYEKTRAVVFHEFGHHVHQMYRWDVKAWDSGVKVAPPIEERIKNIFGRKGPSRYADTNSKEWFAENFALYFSNRKDMTDPKFRTLIEEMIDDAY